MREFWNERYSNPEYAYGKEPNAYFKAKIATLKPGRILLPCEGEGRNAVYAAQLGWDVYAYDMSDSGFEKAMKLAAEKKVKINYYVGTLSDMQFEDNYFDVIALFFAHFPDEVRRENHKILTQMLSPKGHVIMEAFSINHVKYQKTNPTAGGPQSISLLYDVSELEKDFDHLKFKEIKEVETSLSEGKYHQGKASVVRLFGQKV